MTTSLCQGCKTGDGCYADAPGQCANADRAELVTPSTVTYAPRGWEVWEAQRRVGFVFRVGLCDCEPLYVCHLTATAETCSVSGRGDTREAAVEAAYSKRIGFLLAFESIVEGIHNGEETER